MRRVLLVAISLSLFLLPDTAVGDAVYHSQHIGLHPVAGASLRNGFVENIHVNGPQVYAHEVYVLNGAEAASTYQVVIQLFPFDTSCTGAPAAIPTAVLTTNGIGNGMAQFVFRPADVPPELRGGTHGILWQLWSGGAAVYETGCSAVTLD
jgi:hypothetical protein